jgi:hypothetical protein
LDEILRGDLQMFDGHKKGQAAIERPAVTARHLKGQAAMEYLMTYGWALLVIFIVLVILAFYLPSILRMPESCLFSQPGFSCDVKKPVIVSESGTNKIYVLLRIDNQQGQDIYLKGVMCTTATPGAIDKTYATSLSRPELIPSGGNYEFTQKIYCLNDAKPPSSLVGSPNSNFRGTIVILYNYANEVTGAPERVATATITGTIVGE